MASNDTSGAVGDTALDVGMGVGVGVDVGGSRLAGVEGTADVAAPQKVLENSHSFASVASTIATD